MHFGDDGISCLKQAGLRGVSKTNYNLHIYIEVGKRYQLLRRIARVYARDDYILGLSVRHLDMGVWNAAGQLTYAILDLQLCRKTRCAQVG